MFDQKIFDDKMKVTLDRLGTLTQLNAQGIYAYKLNFGEANNLRLGLGAGINQHSFDFLERSH